MSGRERFIRYRGYPVPWVASWSSEDRFEIRPCPYADDRPALWQAESPGIGNPVFAKPHSIRQRKAMALQLCDICGRPLKGRTRVSLSQESPREVHGLAFVPLAVEPMLHKECASLSLTACPSLRRQAADGSLRIRQVFDYRLVAQLLNAAATMEFAGVEWPGAVGHLKLSIMRWTDRPASWLGAAGISG